MFITYRCAPYIYVSAHRRREVLWDEVQVLFSAPLPDKYRRDFSQPTSLDVNDPIPLMMAFASGKVTVEAAAAFLATKDQEGFSSTLKYWWQIEKEDV